MVQIQIKNLKSLFSILKQPVLQTLQITNVLYVTKVRKFGDTDKRKSVLETFNNVNLDPAIPQYYARVIGDRNLTIDKTENNLKTEIIEITQNTSE